MQPEARRDDRFESGVGSAWHVTEVDSGDVSTSAEGLRLSVASTDGHSYSNAQISDYAPSGVPGSKQGYQFAWRPPLRMTVTAWAEVEGQPVDRLLGTGGFGFWNHPFSPDVQRLPRLPRTLWFFFGSPPNNMALAHGVPGYGWKAATMDATHGRALLLAPFALPAVLLMRLPRLYHRLWQPIQRTLKIAEHSLDTHLLAQPHTYSIEWLQDSTRFAVDGATILETPFAPHGPMGFIVWLDNQYAIVTPQGRFGFGLLPVPQRQTLILDHVLIEQLR